MAPLKWLADGNWPIEDQLHTTINTGNHEEAPVTTEMEPQIIIHILIPQNNPDTESLPLRKSGRERKRALSSDYLCFLQEYEYGFGDDDDPNNI